MFCSFTILWITLFFQMYNLPHISTIYRSGIKYNSAVPANSTKQARHDRNGTDQLNMLWEKYCVRLMLIPQTLLIKNKINKVNAAVTNRKWSNYFFIRSPMFAISSKTFWTAITTSCTICILSIKPFFPASWKSKKKMQSLMRYTVCQLLGRVDKDQFISAVLLCVIYLLNGP